MDEFVRSYSIEDLLHRVQGEFVEMPGLQLTLRQAERLWSLGHEDCELILQLLVERRFLFLRSDGRYTRVADQTLEPRLGMGRTPAASIYHARSAQHH